MKKSRCVPEVMEHLDKCSELVGRAARDTFGQDVFSEYKDLSIESPIEQLFYTSCKALMKLYSIDSKDADWIDGKGYIFGLEIDPQRSIKSYRVDFYIEWFGWLNLPPKEKKAVVVECDSQEWHERTEQERRYEKRRDRELAKLGLHTFRFTGKEIKEDPFKPAAEVLGFVMGNDFSDYKEQLALFMDEE